MKFFTSLQAVMIPLFLLLPQAHADFPLDKSQYTYVPGKDFYDPDNNSGTYQSTSLFNTNKVALTFDDGPDAELTPKVLDILKQYGYKATFFLIGDQITEETKPVVLRAIKEGHLIGSHSMHHKDSNKMSEEVFTADLYESITRVRDIIKESGHDQNEVYFRFPMGNYGQAKKYHHLNVLRDMSEQMFGGNCINFVFWTIDPSDGWGKLSSEEIFTNIFTYFQGGQRSDINDHGHVEFYDAEPKNITHGGVMLMHDIQKNSVAELPAILDEFKRRNIQIVPLNEVQEYNFDGRTCGSKYGK
jgi:peptidoglycan/xylan/chitin deacetylase (PgdA/CDA1 family)